MAGGQRTVKVRFTGDTKGLAGAANQSKRFMGVFKKNVEDGTKGATSGVGGIISGAFKNPYVLAAVGVAALGLGQIAGAAIVAGLGIGAISLALIVGIKGAAQDPKVQEAVKAFTGKAGELLRAFSEPFKKPVIEAMKVFGAALDAMRPSLLQIGQIVAPIISQLAPAFADMAKNALPGIVALIKQAAPFFTVIAEKAPALGTAISDFMAKIAEGGPGAQQFLTDLFDFMIWVIPVVGAALGWLAKRYVDWRAGVVIVVNAVRNAWNAFWGFFKGIADRVGASAIGIAQRIVDFKNRATSAWDAVANKVRSAVQTIQTWWNVLRDLARNPISFTVNLIKNGGVPSLPGRASGGPVSAGRSYLVGERGPEIVTMGGNGHVTPNHQLGGDGVTITGDLVFPIDLRDGVQQVIRITNRDLKRRAVQMAGAR